MKQVKVIFLEHKGFELNTSKEILVSSKQELAEKLNVEEEKLFAPWTQPKGKFYRTCNCCDTKIEYDPLRVRNSTVGNSTYKVIADSEKVFNKALETGKTLFAFPDYAARNRKNARGLYGSDVSQRGHNAISLWKSRKEAEKAYFVNLETWTYEDHYTDWENSTIG